MEHNFSDELLTVGCLPFQVAGIYDAVIQYDGHDLGNHINFQSVPVESQDPSLDYREHWLCWLGDNTQDGIVVAGEDITATVWQLDSFGNRIWANGSNESAAQLVRTMLS